MTDWPPVGSSWKRADQRPAKEQHIGPSSQAVLTVQEVEPQEPAGREIRGLVFEAIGEQAIVGPYATDLEGFLRGWQALMRTSDE